ncbi:polyprenyl synthetase family protein (plasmid) [Streptomyces murinus]|nr:polyprenyl synthetase family protein [Streptomyces murinus]
MRAALTLLSCEAIGGSRAAALPAAVAVELVHHASLLHDDIIGGDRIRRGHPALWAAFGVPASILAGDALFFLATQVLHEADGPLAATGLARLNGAVQDLIDGEYADVLFQDRPDVPVAETQTMSQAKTGALMAAACELGALAAGARLARVEDLRAFGAHLGAAFHLADDLLGIWGEPAVTGKPRGGDLSASKKSGPIAYALASGTPAADALARLLAGSGPLSEAHLGQAVALVEATGAHTWALDKALRHTPTAGDHLEAAAPEPLAAAELTALAYLVTGRDR